MSKIGKKPITIPSDVVVEITEEAVMVKGPNANLSVPILSGIEAEIKEGQLIFSARSTNKQTRSNWGTMRALVQNAVEGSKKNFSKSLSIEGVGYRANLEGNTLILSLGFSHPIRFMVPEGIKVEVNGNSVKISGADRAQVGEVAAKIRGFKKPEPYKGKGIRYEGEIVRKKAGKKAVSSS